MKPYYITLAFLLIISCNKNKTEKPDKNISTIVGDTIYNYYKNGNIEEKGSYKDGFKNGWWYKYDSLGSLKLKEEYLRLGKDILYKNQVVYFTENGVDTERSSYFLLEIPDTLFLGRNFGKIKKYNSNFKANHNLITVIIENKYSDNKIKKDTFSDGTLTPVFGIFGYKMGKQNVEGVIEETFLYDKIKEKDTTLVIQKHYKYFNKEVFIKNSNTTGGNGLY